MLRKRSAVIGITALMFLGTAGTSKAAPVDSWPITHGIECVKELFNPIRPDGTRIEANDPAPESAAWVERDRQRRECSRQRDYDRRYHPSSPLTSARYGEDWYRQPARFDGTRWRYTYMPYGGPGADASAAGAGIPGVPAAEIFRPCAPGTCANLPAGLERFEAPYPVVVVFHGFIAQMTHHRFNGEVFAENGYMAIVVNGTHPATGAPNVQANNNGDEVLRWLASPASGVFGQEADLSRVGFVGHSQGSAAALSYQGDPRVHTIIAWDGGDSISDNNCTLNAETGLMRACQPIMYQRTDGEFSSSQTYAGLRTTYETGRNRGLTTYDRHEQRGLDVMHLTLRGTSHIDWVGNGASLAGNRLAEGVTNYYNLAWLDRQLRGKLVFDAEGNVVTADQRDEAGERAFRQGLAQSGFDRMTAMKFLPGTIDKFNISMGFYDPANHVQSDPLFGGNVPYTIEGLWVSDRLSPEFRSVCSISVPDYVNGSDGSPGSPVAARADTGGHDAETDTYGDMRLTGCTPVA
jgi:hypothetical protein